MRGGYFKTALLLATLLPLLATAHALAQPHLGWTVAEDISSGLDTAFAVCGAGSIVYVVGYDDAPGDWEYRIEARDASTGRLLARWVYNPSEGGDLLHDCLVAGGKLYVVGGNGRGGWVILVFDPQLRLVGNATHDPSPGLDWGQAVAADGEYLYVAGVRSGAWYLEKRRLDTLELVAAYTSDPSSGIDFVRGVAVNPATGEVWLVGAAFTESGESLEWRIEVLTPGLERVRAVSPHIPGAAFTVVFDEQGSAYVVGENAVAKLDREGLHISVEPRLNGSKAVYIGGRLYIASAVAPALGGAQEPPRHLLLILDTDLELLDALELGRRGFFPVGRMHYQAGTLYIAGSYIAAENNTGWIIYAVSLGEAEEKCKPKITAIAAEPGQLVYGQAVHIEVRLTESTRLVVAAQNTVTGRSHILYNSTAQPGSHTLEWRPPAAGAYTLKAYIPGDEQCSSKTTRIEVEKAKPRLTVAAPQRVEVPGEALVTVNAGSYSGPLYVNFTSPTGKTYTVEATRSGNTYRARLTLREAGPWKIRAYTPETPGTAASSSEEAVIEAVQPAQPPATPLLLALLAAAAAIAAYAAYKRTRRRRGKVARLSTRYIAGGQQHTRGH